MCIRDRAEGAAVIILQQDPALAGICLLYTSLWGTVAKKPARQLVRYEVPFSMRLRAAATFSLMAAILSLIHI